MRVSALENDPGFVNLTSEMSRGEVPRFVVLLDGKPVPYCVTADEEAGWVLYNRMVDGKPILNDAHDDIVRDEATGKVEIIDLKDIEWISDVQLETLRKLTNLSPWGVERIAVETKNREEAAAAGIVKSSH